MNQGPPPLTTSISRYCSQCGSQVSENSKFCSACGNRTLSPTSTSPPKLPDQPSYRKTTDFFGFGNKPWRLWEILIWSVVSLIIPLAGLILGTIALTSKPKRFQGGILLVLSLGVWFWNYSYNLKLEEKNLARAVIKCRSQMQDVSIAARLYSMDHGDRFPNDYLEMNKATPVLGSLICPSDKEKSVMFNERTFNQSANASYEFYLRGQLEQSNLKEVLLHCPFHQTSILANGEAILHPDNEKLLNKFK